MFIKLWKPPRKNWVRINGIYIGEAYTQCYIMDYAHGCLRIATQWESQACPDWVGVYCWQAHTSVVLPTDDGHIFHYMQGRKIDHLIQTIQLAKTGGGSSRLCAQTWTLWTPIMVVFHETLRVRVRAVFSTNSLHGYCSAKVSRFAEVVMGIRIVLK